MLARMRALAVLLSIIATGAAAQTSQPAAPADQLPWQPTAPYVIAGQDEPGYRNWYMAAPWHAAGVKAFNDYLTTWGVAGIVPTWQLLRTASDWQRCGAQPFEIPPAADWPNLVQTLRFIRDKVIPVVGPVEPVSVYRNPALNVCAGGAQESAHRYMQAVDLVPLRPTTREVLIHELCDLHAREGSQYGVGLGFYAFLRFHIDSRSFRKWGVGTGPEAGPCLSEPPSATVAALPGSAAPQTPVEPAATPPK